MTKERAGLFRMAQHMQTTVGTLLQTMTAAEWQSWALLEQWEHQQREIAEFKKAQALFNG